MNERLKQLRLTLGMTQKEFGERLGVTTSAISYLESGRNNLTEQMLFSICLMFDVRKEWLRTGEGEIFMNHTVGEELAAYMGTLMAENNPEKEEIALLLLKLLVDEWPLIKQNMDKIADVLDWISKRPSESEMP